MTHTCACVCFYILLYKSTFSASPAPTTGWTTDIKFAFLYFLPPLEEMHGRHRCNALRGVRYLNDDSYADAKLRFLWALWFMSYVLFMSVELLRVAPSILAIPQEIHLTDQASGSCFYKLMLAYICLAWKHVHHVCRPLVEFCNTNTFACGIMWFVIKLLYLC